MFSLTYISEATQEINESTLLNILNVARQNNSKLNISGLLLFQNGMFIQNLEGEESKVKELYNHIIKDPRHKKAMVINESEIPERNFTEWSMGFETPLKQESEEVLAYVNKYDEFSTTIEGENVILTIMKRIYDRNK